MPGHPFAGRVAWDAMSGQHRPVIPDECRDVACHVWGNIVHNIIAKFRRGTPRPYICRSFTGRVAWLATSGQHRPVLPT
ncbi:MAG: hypothetical protein HDS84_05270 [Bacteroidales bacterium]|nr:hypothetical protein [Bacteroidales bacterium]MBD5302917.1 hypothetical protein [Bacteroides sp.]